MYIFTNYNLLYHVYILFLFKYIWFILYKINIGLKCNIDLFQVFFKLFLAMCNKN